MAMNFPLAYWHASGPVDIAYDTVGITDTGYHNTDVIWVPEFGLWIVGSTYPHIHTSTDGYTWTLRTPPAHGCSRFAYSPTLGRVVGPGGSYYICRSDDGITWSEVLAPTLNSWAGACWSPADAVFVLVSQDGTGNRAMTSPDGITWTTRTTPGGDDMDACEANSTGTIVATPYSGGLRPLYSVNSGVTWNYATTYPAINARDVCWSQELGLFAAIGIGPIANAVQTSADGDNWTRRTTSTVSCYGLEWCSSFGKFMSAGGITYPWLESIDGITWSEITPRPPTDYNHIKVDHSPTQQRSVTVGYAAPYLNVLVWNPA